MGDEDMENAGADAVWAKVFDVQNDQKDKLAEGLQMMQKMNEQAKASLAEMKDQTNKYQSNIKVAEEVNEGLNEGIRKLGELAAGEMKDPLMCFLCITALVVGAG